MPRVYHPAGDDAPILGGELEREDDRADGPADQEQAPSPDKQHLPFAYKLEVF